MDSGDELLWRNKAVVVVVRLNFGHQKGNAKICYFCYAELNRVGSHAGILRQMHAIEKVGDWGETWRWSWIFPVAWWLRGIIRVLEQEIF